VVVCVAGVRLIAVVDEEQSAGKQSAAQGFDGHLMGSDLALANPAF
jgi:hypothetical protein